MSPRTYGNPRLTARIVLGTVAAFLTLFVLFATGPVGGINVVFAQTTSPNPCQNAQIEWVNPSNDGHTTVSAQDKAGDPAGSGRYHLVAWVTNVPQGAHVEFKYSHPDVGGGNDQTITPNATLVGTDSFEHFWGGPNNALPPDGTATLKAQLWIGSSPMCDQDTQEVEINNQPEEADPGPPPSPASGAAEGVEITSPVNGGQWGVYRNPESSESAGIIKAKLSQGSTGDPGDPPDPAPTAVYLEYSISAPGTEPAWKDCTNSPVTPDDLADGERCQLEPADTHDDVNLVGAIANDTPSPLPTDSAFNDSSDGHRVVPYRQFAGSLTATFQNALGQNTGFPSANQVGGQTAGGCSEYIVATVLDQNDAPIANHNVDSHAQGPTDGVRFASDDNTDAFEAPNSGGHTEESAWACGDGANGTDGEAGGTQGNHEGGGDTDTKHIESTDNTNDSGQFRFRMYSPVTGGTQVSVFADEDGDDQFCSAEANAAVSIGWGLSAASPSGVSPEETNCPVPGETPSPSTTSPSPSTTSPAPSTTSPSPTGTTGPPVQRASTSIPRFRYDRPNFVGRVTSPLPACERNRLVLIKKVRRGADRTVARDRTDRRGRFSARERRANGRYYAVAPQTTVTTPQAETTCGRGRSRTKRV